MRAVGFDSTRRTLCLWAGAGLLPRAAPAASPALEEALLARMAQLGCPGALVAVDRVGAPPLRLALGLADVETKQPMAPDMHMRIASLSKLFVGTAALRLAGQGRLDLDQPIADVVPSVPGGQAITLRHLGTHTSGLGEAIADPALRRAIAQTPQRPWRSDEILPLAFAQPTKPVGSLRYANTNTQLLGLAIAAATAQPAESVVTTLVIDALQLRHTGFTADSGLPQAHPRGYRHGRSHDPVGYGSVFFDATGYSASWAGMAGDMYSTLADLARAIGPLARGDLLNPAMRAEQQRWLQADASGTRHGFHLMQRAGGLGHTGDVPGFSATALYLSEAETSVVVLTNLSNSADGRNPAVELEALVLRGLQR